MKKEIKKHRIFYAFLFFIFAASFYLRVYRTDQVLGFYFDQGRDALVIWDLIHHHRFFLIGPTTGIAGIFRGPFYYYLITPFYLLGNGNPVWPSAFLAFTSVVAIFFMYYLGAKINGRGTGVIAAILGGFSFYIIYASRWLSNPTPMLLLSMLLIWGMLLVTEGKRWAWLLISFVAGCSLFHFGSAGEFFYFPALFIFAIWQRRTLNKKIIFWAAVLFAATAAPQAIFDVRHDGILRNNIKDFLFNRGSFKTNFWDVARTRFAFYYDVFTSKLFDARHEKEQILMAVPAIVLLIELPKIFKNNLVKILLLVFVAPLIGLLFFQGNFGNIYDYYLTGYYLIFLLLFAIGLGIIWKNNYGKAFVAFFVFVFLLANVPLVWSRINDGLTGPNTIAFGNQKQAIDWVYQDVGAGKFNIDVYVPPVIPYAYDYLFKWIGTTKYNHLPETENVSTLYTLYEADPPHPERLDAWLARQKGIGEVESTATFGGITVQKRKRI